MRVAAFQRLPIYDDPARAIGVIERDVAWADQQRIDLAVFPEGFLQGHSYDRGSIERRALALDDVVVQALVQRLSRFSTIALIGLFERRGISVFNSAIVVEGGRILDAYAKAFPIEDGCCPGDRFPCGDAGIGPSASTSAPTSIIPKRPIDWSARAPA